MNRHDQPPPDRTSDYTAPPGYHLEWVADEGWRLARLDEHHRKCRRPGCKRRPVVALKRSNGWWLYCDWHMYGRRIVDGKVMFQRAVPDEAEVA